MKALRIIAALCFGSTSALSQVDRISETELGEQFNTLSLAPRVSRDGQVVLFQAGTLWVSKNLATGALQFGPSYTGPAHRREAEISGNGKYVLFTTETAHDPADINGSIDLYRFDLQAQTMQRISLDGQNPRFGRLDDQGAWIAYSCRSGAEQKACLVHAETLQRREYGTLVTMLNINGNGNFLFFTEDGETFRLSLEDSDVRSVSRTASNANIILFNQSVAADGKRLVAWGIRDAGEDLMLWIWDDDAGGSIRQLLPNIGLCEPSISRDGRWAAFNSEFNIWGSTGSLGQQSYLMNLDTGTVQWISRPPSGEPANNSGGRDPYSTFGDLCFQFGGPQPNADGSVIAFSSWASNLVPNDTNAASDIFILRRGTPPPQVSIPIPAFNGFAAAGLLLGIAGLGLWATWRGRWV